MTQVWACKIGFAADAELPIHADYPMRVAIEEAFERVTGHRADFNFTGWGAVLSDGERLIAAKAVARGRG